MLPIAIAHLAIDYLYFLLVLRQHRLYFFACQYEGALYSNQNIILLVAVSRLLLLSCYCLPSQECL